MRNCESIKEMSNMGILGVYVLASKAKNRTRAVYSENYGYIEASLKQLRKKIYGEKTWKRTPESIRISSPASNSNSFYVLIILPANATGLRVSFKFCTSYSQGGF